MSTDKTNFASWAPTTVELTECVAKYWSDTDGPTTQGHYWIEGDEVLGEMMA